VDVNPDNELEKEPDPVPLVVLLFAVVGFVVVAQQTPRAVTNAPPFDVTLPPVVAPVDVTSVAAVVVSTGTTAAAVVNVTWGPYDVPTLFVAYART